MNVLFRITECILMIHDETIICMGFSITCSVEIQAFFYCEIPMPKAHNLNTLKGTMGLL